MVYWLKVMMLIALSSLSVCAKQMVVWHFNDWPPYFFVENGKLKGEGEAGVSAYKTMAISPEYNHVIKNTPNKRSLALIEKKPNHCRPGIFKTPEREKVMYFSKHIQYYFPYGLTIHKRYLELIKPYIQNDNSVDLDGILGSGNFTLAALHGQSYSKDIDKILMKYKGSKAIMEMSSGTKLRETLLKRLFSDYGFHGTLAIPEEINYNAKHEGLKSDELLYFPVKDTKLFGSGWWGYIACSKSELGKAMIEKINQNIKAIRTEAVAKYRNFLDDNARKIHEEAEKAVFELR